MKYPRLEIDCEKITHNAKALMYQLGLKNITITPVTKVCLGDPTIAKALIKCGAEILADSRVENIAKMRQLGIQIPTMLIRSPMLSQVSEVIRYCDMSINTELMVIQQLSKVAKEADVMHGVLVMVELGDLREGVMPKDLMPFIKQVIELPNIILKGIGANLACRYGVAPDEQNMRVLSDLAQEIESRFNIQLDIVSGGNSASLTWAFDHATKTRVNNLRIGEAIYFGCEPLYQQNIVGLYHNVITLKAEVIECKIKPSMPWGKQALNAFGEKQIAHDRGLVSQAILALGRQDVSLSGITPPQGITIVSSTSDHLLVETSGEHLIVGQKVEFQLDYSSLLSAMTSPFVGRHFVDSISNA